MSGLTPPWLATGCDLCSQEEGIWQLRRRGEPTVLIVGTSCLVDLALTGQLMHPDPAFTFVTDPHPLSFVTDPPIIRKGTS